MAEPFFSIVMPVYNVEAHLEKAVRSVLGQSFSDFELILVDDCSPDASGAVADRLAQEDGRIRVIHKEKNEGQSAARNTALELVRGRYVLFMDSDDYLEGEIYQSIHAALQEHPAQAVIFGLVEDYYDEKDVLCRQVFVRHPAACLLEKDRVRREIIHLENETLYGYVWNKCYQTAHLRQTAVRFSGMTLNEDLFFNVEYFMDVDSLIILDCTPYHYRKRVEGSLTGRFVPEYYELHRKRVEAVYRQYQAWDMCTDEVKKILANAFVRYIFSALQRNCDKRAGHTHKTRKQFLKSVCADPLFQELMPYAQGSSRLVRHMQGLLRHRWIGLCLAEGRMIFIIKQKLPMVFARAKQNR